MKQQLELNIHNNDLVFVEDERIMTDSLRVSEIFGKEHKHVLRDIDAIITKLNTPVIIEGILDELSTEQNKKFSRSNFGLSEFISDRGKKYRKFNMTEEGFAMVVMGYTDVKAMTAKVRFINEFNRMKEELQKRNSANSTLPTTYKDALLALVASIEENEKLQSQNLMLEQVIAENAPKVTYYDTILQSGDCLTVTQIAKDYGKTAQELNIILHEEKVQYKQSGQWLLYKEHLGKGYTQSITHSYEKGNGETGTKLQTKWKQKGRLFIHELLTNRGIVALIDQ
ncbi:Rha family transcriptional regulator [Paenibacillus elgii]|uniref:Rha family transcriptional regulator n=1 Tax=Paenibacillus elgii TaxID=189691 RepID=UPI000248D659|nr:phage regulatory protein/antirepressor Ant [Paenibacillus elgii]